MVVLLSGVVIIVNKICLIAIETVLFRLIINRIFTYCNVGKYARMWFGLFLDEQVNTVESLCV